MTMLRNIHPERRHRVLEDARLVGGARQVRNGMRKCTNRWYAAHAKRNDAAETKRLKVYSASE